MKCKVIYNGRQYNWSFKKFFINFINSFVFVTLICSFILIANSAKAGTNQSPRSIIVHRGDTLWAIAQQINPNIDPRVTIQKLKLHNNLDKADLVVGQKLDYFTQN